MPSLKIIVNPLAGRGYAARISPLLQETFARLGASADLVQTSRAGQAIDLARQALSDGFDTVVAVGGDGTVHEVVNGIMQFSNGSVSGTLACVPAGSGNDFAAMNRIPTDIEQACRLIVEGRTRVIDIGVVTLDGELTRYFDNVVGVGFDALVDQETRRFPRLRGLALYLPAVLKTIFFRLKPVRAQIVHDQQTLCLTTLMTTISNGPREGGGFLVAPDARCNDGELDLMIASSVSLLRVLSMIPHFMRGTHVTQDCVQMKLARHVEITSSDPLATHVDGEILREEAHRVEVRVLPRTLRMIVPPELADG